MDPLAEKYYPISPYAYVANNPIMFIDPDGMRIRPPGRNSTPAHLNFNQRPPVAGTYKYTQYNPISRNNPVMGITWYQSGNNGSNSTSPLVTSEATKIDYGFQSAIVSKSQGASLNFTCALTADAVMSAEQSYQAQLQENTSHLEMPTMPLGENVSSEEWQQYHGDMINYNFQVALEKGKLGPSPMQQIINHILNSDDYEKNQRTEQMQFIYQGR